MANFRTVYEWRITDLPDGKHGHIWIVEDGKDEFGPTYSVMVDPDNEDAWLSKSTAGMDLNMVGSVIDSIGAHEEPWCDFQYPASYYRRIMYHWRKLGSPIYHPKAPGYDAPYFPWEVAGFAQWEIATAKAADVVGVMLDIYGVPEPERSNG
jgi:hypothetical protein